VRGGYGKGGEVRVGKRREGKRKGQRDAGPADRQVPGAPHWQKTGLRTGLYFDETLLQY